MGKQDAPFQFPHVPYHELLCRSAERWPQKTAVIFAGEEIPFAHLLEGSCRLANGLAALGMTRGDRVLLSTYNRPEYLMAFNAISMVGGIVVPMNPSYREEEASFQIRDSGSRLAILQDEVYDRIKAGEAVGADLRAAVIVGEGRGWAPRSDLMEVIPWVSLLSAYPPTCPPPIKVDVAEAVCVLLYSSGTTGRPKGAMLSHQNLVCSQFQYTKAGAISEQDISLIFLPVVHSYGGMLSGGAVAAGATQVLMPRYRLEETLALTQRYRVTLYYATTSVLIELANYPEVSRFDLSSVRYINSGGAPLPPEVAQRVSALTGLRVVNGYGMTEAPLVGTRVPGEEKRIIDLHSGQPLGPFQEGELIVRGPHIMKGYWNDPQATAQVLRDGWLHTGDIGHLDDRGGLHITHRKKEMIKYKGFAISPTELEGVLLAHPEVADCAVVGRPDPLAGEVPKAYVVPKQDNRLAPEVLIAELLTYVEGRVAGYKKIREVELVEEIPRNHYGKTLKRLL